MSSVRPDDLNTGYDTPTVTVTIGRNVNGEPMHTKAWAEFKGDVRGLVEEFMSDIIIDADYTGTWDNMEENAHVFHGFDADPDGGWGPYSLRHEALQQALGALQNAYHQEAIGLAYGQGKLV